MLVIYKGYYSASVPLNTPLWAFAYDVDNNVDRRIAICQPVRGEVIQEGKKKRFYSYYKNTNKLKTTNSVRVASRNYAETKDEAIEGYNLLIQNRISSLHSEIMNAQKDFIR